MVRAFMQHDPERDGTIEVEEYHPGYVEVFFNPPKSSLEAAGLDPSKAQVYRTKLLDINGQHRFLTIHPISTLPNTTGFLKQRYRKVQRIT